MDIVIPVEGLVTHRALLVNLEQGGSVTHRVWEDTAVTEVIRGLVHTPTLKVLLVNHEVEDSATRKVLQVTQVTGAIRGQVHTQIPRVSSPNHVAEDLLMHKVLQDIVATEAISDLGGIVKHRVWVDTAVKGNREIDSTPEETKEWVM